MENRTISSMVSDTKGKSVKLYVKKYGKSRVFRGICPFMCATTDIHLTPRTKPRPLTQECLPQPPWHGFLSLVPFSDFSGFLKYLQSSTSFRRRESLWQAKLLIRGNSADSSRLVIGLPRSLGHFQRCSSTQCSRFFWTWRNTRPLFQYFSPSSLGAARQEIWLIGMRDSWTLDWSLSRFLIALACSINQPRHSRVVLMCFVLSFVLISWGRTTNLHRSYTRSW